MVRKTSLLILALFLIALVIIVLSTYIWLIELENEYVGSFKVLYRSPIVYNRVSNATAVIRSRIIGGRIYCLKGIDITIVAGSVKYMSVCETDTIRFSYTNGLLKVNIGNKTQTLMLTSSKNRRVKIHSLVYTLQVMLPENARQGVYVVNDTYYILNIPYIYFNVKYLTGIGNATVTIKITFNVNGVNISNPYVIEYETNSNLETLFSPWEYGLGRETLTQYANVLKPLTDLDASKYAELKYYIEIYVESKGDYVIEVTVGYPGLRIVEDSIAK